MIDILIVIAHVLAFAFLYRARGGFVHMSGTNVARWCLWCSPLALYAFIVGLRLTAYEAAGIAVMTFLTTWLGLLIPHGRFQADAKAKSIVGMMAVGAVRGLLIGAPLAVFFHEYLTLAVFGAFSGLAYLVGWKFLHGKDSHVTFHGAVFAKGGSEWGEVLTGAFYGLGLGLLAV